MKHVLAVYDCIYMPYMPLWVGGEVARAGALELPLR